MTNKWFVILTRPRWEKKVCSSLQQKGVECYCPLNKVQRKWSDRIKVIEEPLFKSYVFVKVGQNDRTTVRMTEGVVNFVYKDGKPATLKEREIQTIKDFLTNFADILIYKAEAEENFTGNDSFNGLVPEKRKISKFRINGNCFILSGRIDKSRLIESSIV